MIQVGATEAMAVNLAVQIAESMSLTLDQMKEGARLIAIQTAKQEHHTLTAETTIPLDSTDKQCSGLNNTSEAEHQVKLHHSVAGAHLREAISHMS